MGLVAVMVLAMLLAASSLSGPPLRTPQRVGVQIPSRN